MASTSTTYNIRIYASGTTGTANINNTDFVWNGTAGQFHDVQITDKDGYLSNAASNARHASDIDEIQGEDNRQTITSVTNSNDPSRFQDANITIRDVAIVQDAGGNVIGAAYQINSPDATPPITDVHQMFVLNFTPAPGTTLNFHKCRLSKCCPIDASGA